MHWIRGFASKISVHVFPCDSRERADSELRKSFNLERNNYRDEAASMTCWGAPSPYCNFINCLCLRAYQALIVRGRGLYGLLADNLQSHDCVRSV